MDRPVAEHEKLRQRLQLVGVEVRRRSEERLTRFEPRTPDRGAREQAAQEVLRDQVGIVIVVGGSVGHGRAAEERGGPIHEVAQADRQRIVGGIEGVQLSTVATLGRDEGAAPNASAELARGEGHGVIVHVVVLAVELG